MNYIIGWFLSWLTGWADLVDGICWIVTMGIWRPEVSLYVDKLWLDWIEFSIQRNVSVNKETK